MVEKVEGGIQRTVNGCGVQCLHTTLPILWARWAQSAGAAAVICDKVTSRCAREVRKETTNNHSGLS